MDPNNILFKALIVGPTSSGKTQYLVNQLRGPFSRQARPHGVDTTNLCPQQNLRRA